MNRRNAIASVSALALIGSAGLLIAGPLNPPAGPVASTMKPLSDIEPRIAINATNTPGDSFSLYKISQPGSYYLTGNITGVAGKTGIRITADDVTIDLNGFTLTGTANALSGVGATTNRRIEIKNGVIINWPNAGVECGQGSSIVVRDVIAEGSNIGISVGSYSIVERCIARGNSATGFDIGSSASIRYCEAGQNTDGFTLRAPCTAENCSASNNTRDGFACTDSVRVYECVATSNGRDGIAVSFGAEVRECYVMGNTRHGVRFGSFCSVEDNNARGNDGAGFYGASNGSRTVIRGNNSSQNGVGIQLDAASNLVVGNTCSANTNNYSIVASNRVATIVTLATSGAITGSSGGTAVSTPDANYAY